MLTRYGYDVVIAAVVIALAVSAAAILFVDWKSVRFGIPIAAFLCLLFTLWFFRDPERVAPQGAGLVLSPADGTVCQVTPVVEPEFLIGEGIQISVFMSPLNVHVNRYPMTGTVGYYRYVPGEYFAAFDDKASLRNEQTHIGVQDGDHKVLFKQIAGFLARRIVAEVKVGDQAVAGQRFGMIKFGSRVDVIVPKSADILVVPGEHVSAGETILASIKP